MKKCVSIAMLLWLAACQQADDNASPVAEPATDGSAPVVYAVHYPLAWMAEQIGGGIVDVVFPAPSGVDPAHWKPSPEMVLGYQDADLVLANGAHYAGWIQFASLSPSRLADTTAGLEGRFLPAEGGTHRHGPAGTHEHGGAASHTWLDPELAGEQARGVARALTRIAPDSAIEFERRLGELLVRLDELDRATAGFFSELPPTQIFYSHPVYQYLDARFDLDGLAFTWEPDVEPDEAEWRRLEAAVDRSRDTLMIWEAPPLHSVADRLEAMGITVVVFETGANPEQRDGYDSVLEQNLVRLRESRSGSAVPGKDDQPPVRGG